MSSLGDSAVVIEAFGWVPGSEYLGSKWYITEETQEACVLLVRYLMKELGIPKDHVLRHGDIVNKWCPAPYFTNNGYNGSWTWDIFREKLAALPRSRVPEFPVRYDSE